MSKFVFLSVVFKDGGTIMGVGWFTNGGKGGGIYPSANSERNRCFLVELYSLILKRPRLEVATKGFSSASIVLAPYPTWKCVSKAISGAMYISEVPGCHLLQQMSSQ